MLASDITHGHVLLADWLLLIAAVLFVVAAVLARRPLTSSPGDGAVTGYVALALVAVALLVL